jgi:hypothetical protein
LGLRNGPAKRMRTRLNRQIARYFRWSKATSYKDRMSYLRRNPDFTIF